MQKLLIAALASTFLGGSALAADMPEAGVGYDWSGFYIGAQAGYGWADFEYEFNTNGHYNTDPGDTVDASAEGFIGGGHIGYNWQFDQMVAGLEIGGFVGDIEDTDPSFVAGKTVTNDIEWFLQWLPASAMPSITSLFTAKPVSPSATSGPTWKTAPTTTKRPTHNSDGPPEWALSTASPRTSASVSNICM